MILKNSFIIFVALLVGGALNFGSISIFSRLLNPAEYGTYALAAAASTLSIAFLFQWILHSFIRYLPQRLEENNKTYLANFLLILAGVSVCFLTLALLAYGINASIGNIFGAFPLLIWILVPAAAVSETAFNAVSHYTRLVREHVRLYALAVICRSVIYIVCGYFLVQAGFSFTGLLFALVLSFLLPAILLWSNDRKALRLSKNDLKREIVREIMAFGFPIIAVTTIQTAISSTDNFLLTLLIGPEATGHFAVALDLVTKSLVFLMIVVHRTTYPLVVKILEHEGIEAAKRQYNHNTIILMALSIPACAGLATLAGNISTILLGAEFQETVKNLIPFLTLASFLNCAFQFYLTPAFHLSKKTHLMIAPVMIAFVVNIVVSVLCIPSFGINGAVIGSFCAYLTCFILSLYFVKRIFPLPFPLIDLLKIMMATVLMTAAIWMFRGSSSIFALMGAISVGGIVYIIACMAFNVGGYRRFARRYKKSK